jgi:hypothetical protein
MVSNGNAPIPSGIAMGSEMRKWQVHFSPTLSNALSLSEVMILPRDIADGSMAAASGEAPDATIANRNAAATVMNFFSLLRRVWDYLAVIAQA